jgi:hypothetical protein
MSCSGTPAHSSTPCFKLLACRARLHLGLAFGNDFHSWRSGMGRRTSGISERMVKTVMGLSLTAEAVVCVLIHESNTLAHTCERSTLLGPSSWDATRTADAPVSRSCLLSSLSPRFSLRSPDTMVIGTCACRKVSFACRVALLKSDWLKLTSRRSRSHVSIKSP